MLPYLLAQIVAELPYIAVQTVMFTGVAPAQRRTPNPMPRA